MKRTRAQQPKADEAPQDPAGAPAAGANPKPQRRAKQPRQPKAGTKATKAAASAAAAAAAAAANAASAAASSPVPETAPAVPDVLCGVDVGGGGADAQRAVECWDLDAGMSAAEAAWWTWGVDEEKLLGWFPFVEEDFRCGAAGRAADAEVAAFDHDIWSIW